MSGISKRVRQVVRERDNFTCQRCGKYLGPFGEYSLQHRRPRGMGGSSDPETNLPANLITLCGSAVTGCHGAVEAHRVIAGNDGFLLHQTMRPADQPVNTFRGWIRLDNEGGWRTAFGRADTRSEEPS